MDGRGRARDGDHSHHELRRTHRRRTPPRGRSDREPHDDGRADDRPRTRPADVSRGASLRRRVDRGPSWQCRRVALCRGGSLRHFSRRWRDRVHQRPRPAGRRNAVRRTTRRGRGRPRRAAGHPRCRPRRHAHGDTGRRTHRQCGRGGGRLSAGPRPGDRGGQSFLRQGHRPVDHAAF